MCGIAGFWSGSGVRPSGEIAAAMAERIAHRGPDGNGIWLDTGAGLAFAHARLAIIDLSSAGRQPMTSPCGRFTLVYNGEIYNHTELRSTLEKEGGHFDWRGHSDTETLLAALRHWGVDSALRRLNGMFAFGLWDGVERTLVLARDRMGQKPLYYGRSAGSFLFGSELKSLTAHPDWLGAIDRDALMLYLGYGYVPAPLSIYQGITKLPPAHSVTVRENGTLVSDPKCYWDIVQVAERGAGKVDVEGAALTAALDELLRDTVARRMVADVPLGVLLSGGYDSTAVTAMMQAQSAKPVKTFTVGFHEATYNEAEHAKAVAAYLGTDHTEIYVTPDEAMTVIPRLPAIWDEPFADASQIPTLLVCELAKRSVTVALSGDGGDELFGGYNRHVVGPELWRWTRRIPRPLRRMSAGALHAVPQHYWENGARLLPKRFRLAGLADKVAKFAGALSARDESDFYRQLVSRWHMAADVVRQADTYSGNQTAALRQPSLQGFRERMMFWDATTYLPDDILVKTDRASMAVSLEVRAPLLDHRLVEFAWQVPTDMKCRNGQGKWLLRHALYRYVPQDLMERPKMGFDVPIGDWLRGPLRDWAESLLNERRLLEEGYLDPTPVRHAWLEYLSGRRKWQYKLWSVLMFQAWLEEQRHVGMVVRDSSANAPAPALG